MMTSFGFSYYRILLTAILFFDVKIGYNDNEKQFNMELFKKEQYKNHNFINEQYN